MGWEEETDGRVWGGAVVGWVSGWFDGVGGYGYKHRLCLV